MSEPLVFECPSCGSPITTDGESLQVVCAYCGRTVTVPEELRAHPEPQPIIYAPPAAPEEAKAAARRSRGCGCAVAPAIILLLALGALSLLNPNQGIRMLQAAAALPTPRPTIVPIDRPLAASVTQQVAYAGLQLSVTGGTITNQAPEDAAGRQGPQRTNQVHAYLDVKVANPTANGVVADQNLLALQLAGGRRYREETGWMAWLDGQSVQEAKLSFTVPMTATWQGAQLVIGLPGKEPAVLPLDGPAAPSRYPLRLKDKGKATVQDVDYEVQSATVDLDADGQRAAAGHRFLIFALRMFNHSANGVAITPSNFRLAAGADMLAPLESPSEYVAGSSVLQAQVVFDVPANAAHVELQVGEVGGSETRRLPVTMPAP